MKLTKFAYVCALTSALAACGGGGGGSDSQAPTTRTLDGVAAKGLIKNGVVKVFSYTADGVKSASPIATTRTLADGSYSVSLGSNIGLFTVEVSADASTTMLDEFAGEIVMPVGMTLRSLLKLDSAASTAVKGFVTPFTDMLVNAAVNATGGLTTANAAAAQTGVTAMLGFNPLTTKPLMSNSDAGAAATDASEKLQSVTLAALSKLASDSSNSLGCAGTVSQKIECIVKETTGSAVLTGSTLSITSAVQDQLISALDSVASNPVINKTTLTTFAGQPTFSQATVSATSSALGPIDAAKALFASLRTNINAWSAAADNGGALTLSAEAMVADFNTAIAPLDQDLADWVLLSERGVVFYKNYVDGGNSGASNQAVIRDGNEIGKCFLYADAAATTEVASGSAANNVFCRLSKAPVAGTESLLAHTTSAIPPVTTNLTRQQFTKAIQLTPVSSSTTSFSYTARARMETAYFNRDVNGIINKLSIDDIKATIGTAGAGTVAYSKNGNAVADITINGFMPARTDVSGVAITDQESWNVNYLRTAESNITKYALSGDITALKGGVPVGSVGLKDGSYIRTMPLDVVTEVNLALVVAGANSNVTGTLSLSNFSTDTTDSDSSYIPTDFKFVGSFTNASSEFFKGTLAVKATGYKAYNSSLPDSTDNFIQKDISLAGVFKIPARPALTLTLNGSNPSFGSESFNGQYDDGTSVVLFSATDKNAVNISSANGVSLTLTKGATTADVMKDNSKIATVDLSAGMVNFTDGSFQSLK